MFGNLFNGFLGSQGTSNTYGAVPQSAYDQAMIGTNGGFVGSSFNAVLESVNNNASQGISPFGTSNRRNLSPEQVAAQMQIGGPSSLLPILGNRFLPKLLFPIAGLWSLVGGVKALIGLRRDAAAETRKFDPSQLSYYQTTSSFEEVFANPIFNETQQQREMFRDSKPEFQFSGSDYDQF